MNISETLRVSFIRFKFLWLLCIGLAVCLFAIIINRDAAQDLNDSWVAVTEGTAEHKIGLVGKIEPIETLIISAPFDGTVMANTLSVGKPIKRGDILFTSDPSIMEVRVREALSNLLRAQNAVETYNSWNTGPEMVRVNQALRVAQISAQSSERELSQVEMLYNKGIVSRNERDSLRQQRNLYSLELVAAAAEVESVSKEGTGNGKVIAEMELINATTNYEQLKSLIEHKTVYAPHSGVIMSIGIPSTTGKVGHTLQEGALLTKGQEIMRIANLEGLKVVALVSESDIGKLSLNQRVEISGDGFPGHQLSGYVSSINRLANESDADSGTAEFSITVTIYPGEQDVLNEIMLGMSAYMKIVLSRNDKSLIVPHSAIYELEGALFVDYRDTVNDSSERRQVRVGISTTDGVEVYGLGLGYVKVNSGSE